MPEQTQLRLLLTGSAASLLDHVALPEKILNPRGDLASRAVELDLACDIGNAQAIFKMTAA